MQTKTLFKTFITLGLLIAIGIGAGAYQIVRWSRTPLRLSQPVTFEFPRGTTLPAAAKRLEENGLINNAWYFSTWIRFIDRSYNRFQAGVYQFESDVTPGDIVKAMKAGDIYTPVLAEFTIPEGFTLDKIIKRLIANGISSEEQLRKLSSNPKFLKKLKVPGKTLEGYLYPARYTFTNRLPTGEEAFTEMVRTFYSKLPNNYESEVRQLGLNLQQAVTFASLIELETMYHDEMPMISEVIWRRLKNNQHLGIDAAIIYGIPDYDGDIKWKHLRDTKNPYNLRKHKGFPPTPIGSPSREALAAVLSPTRFGYNFYVLNASGDGRHQFSKTLAEHNRYVKKYLEATSQRQASPAPKGPSAMKTND